MTEKFKILAKYIKDMSSETPDIETFLFVKENISKYQLNIDINSKPLKNKLIEVNTTLKFEDKEPNEKKSYYEIISGAAIAFAAILLILPGFATDFLGFLLIFPITRKLIFGNLSNKLKKRGSKKDNFIDGEYEDIDDNNDRKI